MGLILDTSALVEIDRRKSGLREAIAPYVEEPVALPAIVWAELLVGVRLAANARVAARRRASLEQLRLHIPIIDFTPEVAENYADIYTECSQAGKPIPQNDVAVAATARTLNYAVVVGNKDESHFRAVCGLQVLVLK